LLFYATLFSHIFRSANRKILSRTYL